MMRNKGILSLVLCLAQVVSAQAYSPEYDENGRLSILKADLNRDGYFNILDIGLVASAWLDERCGLSNPCSGADVYPPGGDSVIDLRDFAVTAEDYGQCTDPTNPDCLHLLLTLFEPPSEGTSIDFRNATPVEGLWVPGGRGGTVGGYLAIPVTLEDWSWESDDYGIFSGVPLIPLQGGGGGSVHTIGRCFKQ